MRTMYSVEMPIEELREKISYDPLTGVFLWRVRSAYNIYAGMEAGCMKPLRTNAKGKTVSYRYIRIGKEMPASRVAWAIHYGEWPQGRIRFKNGDTTDHRIDNLVLGKSLVEKFDTKVPGGNADYLRAHRKLHPDTWRESALQNKYGISLAEYVALATEQGNKCAICRQPETATRGGNVKMLAVDHDHITGKVRGLLCYECNTGIGKLKDNPQVLIAAAEYLQRHSASNVVPLKALEESA